MTITYLNQRRDGSWFKLTITRSHTRLRPALREQGSTSWSYKGVEKFLVRRWHGELGKWRLLVQHKPVMTEQEIMAWESPNFLKESRKFK